jgi:lipopolysaccharide export LptBFGC system permease protein LptF
VVQVLASGVVFTVYYVLIMAGETLAARLVLPPALAMWSANVLMLSVAVVALPRRRPLSVAH